VERDARRPVTAACIALRTLGASVSSGGRLILDDDVAAVERVDAADFSAPNPK